MARLDPESPFRDEEALEFLREGPYRSPFQDEAPEAGLTDEEAGDLLAPLLLRQEAGMEEEAFTASESEEPGDEEGEAEPVEEGYLPLGDFESDYALTAPEQESEMEEMEEMGEAPLEEADELAETDVESGEAAESEDG